MKTDFKRFDFTDPEKWTFIAVCYLNSPKSDEAAEFAEMILLDIQAWNDADQDCEMWDHKETSKRATKGTRFNTKGTCDHCGAWFHYGAAYEHIDTGEVAIVGNICATNKLNLTAHEYADKQLRKVAKAARTKAKMKIVRKENLEYLNTKEDAELRDALNYPHNICESIRDQYINSEDRYLSPRQIAVVKKAMSEDWAHLKEKEAEPDPVPIPESLFDGRQKITGRVLGFKEVDGYMGPTMKCLFFDDRGFKLWGSTITINRGVHDRDDILNCERWADKEDRIEFFARIQKSEKDKCFGFYKRPTKAKAIEQIDDEIKEK